MSDLRNKITILVRKLKETFKNGNEEPKLIRTQTKNFLKA